LQDYFGELGLDWQEQIEQMDREKKFIAALSPAPKQAAVSDAGQGEPNAQPEPVQTPAAPEELVANVTETVAMQAKVEVLPAKTEAFTMKDDPDYQLSDKELDMVTKAVGLKNKPAKKKK
jgi:hypothetical protein